MHALRADFPNYAASLSKVKDNQRCAGAGAFPGRDFTLAYLNQLASFVKERVPLRKKSGAPRRI
jgi:hypothetical protein